MVPDNVYRACKEYVETLTEWPETIYDIDGVYVLEMWKENMENGQIVEWGAVFNNNDMRNYRLVHRKVVV